MNTHGFKWLGLSVLLLAGLGMVAPAAFAASDGGYSATCKDGTAWTGASKRGACRGHKGVKAWNSEAAAPEAKAEKHAHKTRAEKKSEAAAKKSEAAAPMANAAPGAAPEATAVSAMCKDGTEWSGKSKRGACRGHKGVKGWGDTAAAAPRATPAALPAARETMPGPQRRANTRTVSTAGGALGAPAPGGGAGRVWVNSESKTYHCQGSKWYGTTKHGEYMTQAQATAQGYHADHGKACSG